MSSARAYKSIKRRMAVMKEKSSSGKAKQLEKNAASTGLLKRKSGDAAAASKSEDMQEVIAAYIEAVRGVQE